MVLDELTATAGEDGRTAGKACPLLLAAVGGEPSDAAPVRKHAAADSGFAAASRIGAAARRNQSGRRRGVEGEVSEKSLENKAIPNFLSRRRPFPVCPSLWDGNGCKKTDPAEATGSILVRSGESKMEIPV